LKVENTPDLHQLGKFVQGNRRFLGELRVGQVALYESIAVMLFDPRDELGVQRIVQKNSSCYRSLLGFAE
jgi:hypothetical protein